MAIASNPDAPALQVLTRVLGSDITLSGRLHYKASVEILATGICGGSHRRKHDGFRSLHGLRCSWCGLSPVNRRFLQSAESMLILCLDKLVGFSILESTHMS